MTDEKHDGASAGAGAKDAATKAAIELAKQVYDDGAKPTISAAGRVIALPFRLLDAALGNLQAFLTNHEARQRALEKGMVDRWAKIPPERLTEPPPNVVGPLLLGYSFVQGEAETPLREMYEQLLATSMDVAHKRLVHPSFPELLRQMTPEEARLLKQVAGLPAWRAPVIRVDLVVKPMLRERRTVRVLHEFTIVRESSDFLASVENLERLKLVELEFGRRLPIATVYEGLKKRAAAETEVPSGYELRPIEGVLTVTEFGTRFLKTCVVTDESEIENAPADDEDDEDD